MVYDYKKFESLLYKMVQQGARDLHILGCTNKTFTSKNLNPLKAATNLAFRTMAEPYLDRNSLTGGRWWLSLLSVEAPKRHGTRYQYPIGGQDSFASSLSFALQSRGLTNVSLCVPAEVYRVFRSEWPNVIMRAFEAYKAYEDTQRARNFPFTVDCFPTAIWEDLKSLLRGSQHSVDHGLLMFCSTLTQGMDIEVVDAISCEKYEGNSAKCQLAVISNAEELMPFRKSSQLPFTMENVRALRKQAEMGRDDMCLAISRKGQDVYTQGLILRENAFCPVITIHQPMHWLLSLPRIKDGEQISSVQLCRNGSSFSIPPLTDDMEATFFHQLCRKNFTSQNEDEFEKLEHIVSGLRKNAHKFHGVSILVAENAEAEAHRLCEKKLRGYQLMTATDVNPDYLSSFLTHLAAIDGAIVLSTSGNCTGFATILDGVAVSQGNPARGARFNSAQTYLDNINGAAVAVVISTDGSVDYLQKSR